MIAKAEPTARQEVFRSRCAAAKPYEVVDFIDDNRGIGKTWALLDQARILSTGDAPMRGVLVGNLSLVDAAVRHLSSIPGVKYKPVIRQFSFPNGSFVRVTNRECWQDRFGGTMSDWVGIDCAGNYPEPEELAFTGRRLNPNGLRRIMIVGER